MKSPIHYGDSYKYGHSGQYFPMTVMYDYLSSRGGATPATLFTGLQGLMKQYLTKPITMADVYKLERRAKLHGIPFDTAGWTYIATECKGLLPIEIKAIPEGTLIPTGLPLMTVESVDPKVPWIAGFVETLLMKVWYPTTISTKAYYVKKLLEKHGSPEWVQFAYHAFGDRACTSPESAAIAGFAHMAAGFKGTDNFDSLEYCEENYHIPNGEVAGYSVYATEHSTTTSHGRGAEEEFVYAQLLAHPNTPIMSFVADSYDVYQFTNFCTSADSRIRKLIESRPHQKLVLRPDSGDPLEVLDKMIIIMRTNKLDTIPHTKHLFKDFAILWSDGINYSTIKEILEEADRHNFAAENFVFGSGGDLMQHVNRDTHKFAIKCSSITDQYGQNFDIFKDPITDPGKKSLKGRVTTYIDQDGKYVLGLENEQPEGHSEALQMVFNCGTLYNESSLEEIRNRN